MIYDDLGVPRIINAYGTNTRLSGGLMAPEVLAAMAEAARATDRDLLLDPGGAGPDHLVVLDRHVLRAGGLAADTPVVVVRRATLADQQHRLGTLEDLARPAALADTVPVAASAAPPEAAAPGLLVIGDVVRGLAWLDTEPSIVTEPNPEPACHAA